MTEALIFQKAVKLQEKARIALDGVTGAGKTWTALSLATYWADKEGGRVAVIDSERSSAKKYASDFDFDHLTLPSQNPHTYIAAVRAAIEAEYAVIVIDSLSHAWEGTLELKDDVAKRSRTNNSFDAWREVTPVHNELIDTMLRAPTHLIVTMRTTTEYLVDSDQDGKTKISKVGLKPVQRSGVEYEFDIVGDLDQENTLTISKTRCSALNGEVIRKPGAELARVIWDWLKDGEPVIGPAEAAALIDAFSAITDVHDQTVAKKEFIAVFGRPDQMLAARFDEAVKWVNAKVGELGPQPVLAGADDEEPF